MDGRKPLFQLLLSNRVLVSLLIFVCLPLTIFQQINSRTVEATISESKGTSGVTLDRTVKEHGLKFRRSLGEFKFRATNAAPCTMPGTFLNENRKNGRWYWYCYYDESGQLAWMSMRCPNKRLFDPVIQKCVVNLTSSTEAAVTTEQTTLSTSSTATVTTSTIEPTTASTTTVTTPSTTALTMGPTIGPITASTTTVTTPSTTTSTMGPTIPPVGTITIPTSAGP